MAVVDGVSGALVDVVAEWEGIDRRAGRASDRFVAAHLAALRIAAIALAIRPRRRTALRDPNGGRRNVWDVLGEVAPELGEWAMFFGSLQLKRQAVQAGATALVTERDADDLVRDVRAFADAVEFSRRLVSSA